MSLSFAVVLFPIELWLCAFTEDADLRQIEIPRLDLDGCWIKSIDADGAVIKGDASLSDGFHADRVELSNAQIGGNLLWLDGTFNQWLAADRANIKGTVSLYAAHVRSLSLFGAQIGGDLACDGGAFNNPGRYTLDASLADVKGNVLLSGGITLGGAKSVPISFSPEAISRARSYA